MTCPSCGSPATKQEVHKTMDHHSENLRMRRCLCGARWVTIERLKRGTLIVPGQSPVTLVKVTSDPPVTDKTVTRDPPVTFGGVGGGLPLGLFPVLSSDPSQQSGSGARAIHRGRPDAVSYPPEFLVLWTIALEQGKPGNKYPAFKSWSRLNASPELNALIASRFREWMKTDGWRRGFNFHFVTWLNQRGWEEPPTAADLRGTEAVSAPARDIRGADYCVWHQRHQNDGTVSRYPKGGCPGCKSVADAESERVHAASVAKIMAERARKTQ